MQIRIIRTRFKRKEVTKYALDRDEYVDHLSKKLNTTKENIELEIEFNQWAKNQCKNNQGE